jgi:hypothetical protein
LFEDSTCNLSIVNSLGEMGKQIFLIGEKQFGYNLNWIARIPNDKRMLLRNPVLKDVLEADYKASSLLPSSNYISLMGPLTDAEGVLVTDETGRLLTSDRYHLTKYGAIYLGKNAISMSALHPLLSSGFNIELK